MENFITSSYSRLEEIQLSIYDAEIIHYGGNQYWFSKKNHQLSGCGPVAAANITAYLSQTFPDKFSNLYPFKGVLNKKDFMEHMVEIRKYVKPGIFGLTSVHQFSNNVLSFAQSRGVSLAPHILDEDAASMQDAINFINQALSLKLPVAILVLTHPVKEFEEYAWHWMTITHLRLNPEDGKYCISVSTYGEYREIDLDLLWNHRRPKDIIKLAYFT
ncbi:hypothetical protein HNQ80_000545 [Anaerosolibacter carboniphilus]|uniref:Peptidase C39-like domain-containing protein n=1 Tax=Anaerosolibacter carboniphilus TaxID=1417629 RepID=A0A841KWB1_9FIRM|nr:hypothetical protein [Anaerosolibacter carboniphilus]MBB6214465.1 hypothetical protein [Anaerosolibacter carboniphilus]